DKREKIEKWLKDQVDILWEAYQSADPRSAVELKNFHPDLIGENDDVIFSKGITYADIESTVLEEYGYINWEEVKDQGVINAKFEAVVNIVLSGNLDKMKEAIIKYPEVINEKSQFGHKAGVIHYLAANGVEIWRQYLSANSVKMMELLMEAGADPDADNNIYGGSTLRSLIETSDHTFKSGLMDQMLERLAVYGY
ncbi:MAG: hypothetical protein ACI9RP_002777, partial [Cyclobacteriaceae bacterium]